MKYKIRDIIWKVQGDTSELAQYLTVDQAADQIYKLLIKEKANYIMNSNLYSDGFKDGAKAERMLQEETKER